MQNKDFFFGTEQTEKGGAAARQLCINSSTRVRQDMHAHGVRERCRHAITKAGKKVAYLQHHSVVSEIWSAGGFGQSPLTNLKRQQAYIRSGAVRQPVRFKHLRGKERPVAPHLTQLFSDRGHNRVQNLALK